MKLLLITALALVATLGGKPAHAEDLLTTMGRIYDREQQIWSEDFNKKNLDWRKHIPKDLPPPPPEIDPKLTAEEAFANIVEGEHRLLLWQTFNLAPYEPKGKDARSLTASEMLRFHGLMYFEELTELMFYKQVCGARAGILDIIEARWRTLPDKLRDARVDYIQYTVENSVRAGDKAIYESLNPAQLRDWKPDTPSGAFCKVMSEVDERNEFDHIYKAAKETK